MRCRLERVVIAAGARVVALPESIGLGLGDEGLALLAVEYHFGTLAGHFRPFGGPLELREIAWWGSALADIACAAGGKRSDEELLRDAALFHLGVALFDDVIDTQPERSDRLAEALHPGRLGPKLENPTDTHHALRSPDAVLNLIAALFDGALEGIGRRLAHDREWRRALLQMLQSMYASELQLAGDPQTAKTLPFAFVGHLAVRPGDGADALLQNLSIFLGLWDDWLDLVADVWFAEPNAFLDPRSRQGWRGRLRGTAKGLGLLMAGGTRGSTAGRRLTLALRATLDAAKPLPPAAQEKLKHLCLYMLSTGPKGEAGC